MNKVALITGGTRGIGRATALALAHEGCDIAIGYIKSVEEAATVVKQITSLGRRAISIQADVSKLEDLRALVDITIQEFGRIDILINNAGIFIQNVFDQSTEEKWDKILNTNLKSIYFLAQIVAPLMKQQKTGNIVNIASTSGNITVNNSVDYGVSKAGVIYLTKCLAKILAPEIRVNCVSPGPTVTDMTGYKENVNKKHYMEKKIPLGKVNDPEHIAAVIVFLVSTKAETITGQIVEVDGGFSL